MQKYTTSDHGNVPETEKQSNGAQAAEDGRGTARSGTGAKSDDRPHYTSQRDKAAEQEPALLARRC